MKEQELSKRQNQMTINGDDENAQSFYFGTALKWFYFGADDKNNNNA